MVKIGCALVHSLKRFSSNVVQHLLNGHFATFGRRRDTSKESLPPELHQKDSDWEIYFWKVWFTLWIMVHQHVWAYRLGVDELFYASVS